ncbi:DUF6571 family protein [Fodinicola acaciae]|uniref:DUF6571 family protein n=1 Tax=Fodinicola acaciae TaxID=2681555 RepID=UPI0013D26BDD|nr:DUF6571 family protein [Fodinicola acaciae]
MVRPVADGGGGGLGPLQKHPAKPGDIRTHATKLVTDAGKAIDQKAVTDAAFNPATDNWDGIAAPELRSAPEPVRKSAHDLSSKLAWAAVPLNYWAHQVESFNSEVDKISAALTKAAGSDGHYGAKGDNGKPPTDDQINTAKANATSGADTKWYTAYNNFIVNGATAVAGMFKDGPTDANVKLARSVGAIPSTPGVFTVYPAEWHQQEMERLAHQAAVLAKKINGPHYVPNKADLDQLNALLKNQTDPAFATKFLNEVGAVGLLQLTARVASFQRDEGTEQDTDSRKQLAALMGSVQSGLGAVLATATRNPGGRNQVSWDWVGDLTKAARGKVELGQPDQPERWNIYGYQALGTLLSTNNKDAKFGGDFLGWVGDDMIQFERDHGGSKVWTHSLAGAGLRMNWVNGYADGVPGGFDPVAGLMTAFKNDDPNVAKQWFTHEELFDGHDQPRLPLVDYLLTDRDWPLDLQPAQHDTMWHLDHKDYSSAGLNTLGEVLDNAVTKTDQDAASKQLTESIVWELGHDEKVTDPEHHGGSHPFSDVDVVPPSIRDSVGHILAYNMNGVFDTLDGGDPHQAVDPKTGDADPYTPGIQQNVPYFDKHALDLVLADVGKDKDAYNQVAASAITYAGIGYDSYLHGHVHADGNPGVGNVTTGLSHVYGDLDFGAVTAHHKTLGDDDKVHNDQVANTKEVVGLIANKAIGKIPVAGDAVSYAYGKIADEVANSLKHDSTGQANYDAGALQIDSRNSVETAYSAAVYRNASDSQIPDSLIDPHTHHRKPMTEWSAQDWSAWEYQLKDPHGPLQGQGSARSGVGDSYEGAFGHAGDELNKWEAK